MDNTQQPPIVNVSLEVAVGVLNSQMVDMKKQNDRIEQKLDSLSTVSQEDFKKFTQYVEDTFVKKESVKGLKAVGFAIITAIAVSATLGVAKLLGFKA